METNSLQEQITALRERVSQDETEFGKRTNILLDEILALQGEFSVITDKVDSLFESQRQLTATVTNLSGFMLELAQRNIELAQHDRELAQRNTELAERSAEDRAEIRRIWEYLQLQQRNQGNGQG